MTEVHTWSIASLFRLEGLQNMRRSIDVQQSLIQFYHSLICVMPMVWSPKILLNPSNCFHWSVTKLESNSCIIFAGRKKRRALTTLPHSEADRQRLTPSAGPTRFTHAHCFLHLPTTGRCLRFICFCVRNSGWILFERPWSS